MLGRRRKRREKGPFLALCDGLYISGPKATGAEWKAGVKEKRMIIGETGILTTLTQVCPWGLVAHALELLAASSTLTPLSSVVYSVWDGQ